MPKAEVLYAGLTLPERKKFALRMQSHKRESLQSLFKYIVKECNSGGNFKKEVVFQKIFQRKYSPEEDYLLRHELRLLVSEIYEFMREAEISAECETDVNFSDTMLLRGLLKRRCFEEVEHLFPKYFASAIERLNFEQARRQADIYFQYLVFHREISPEILEQARSVMVEQIRILKLIYRTGFALNQNNRAMCEAMLAMTNKPVQQSVEFEIDTDFSEAETPYILYITSILKSYFEPSLSKRIELVRHAMENITEVQHIYKTEKLLSLSTLGTLHYMNSDYASARKIFEDALSYSHEYNLPRTINLVELLYNYVGTLMRLELYVAALEVMDEYRDLIDRHIKLALRFVGFRCFCYIFLKNLPKHLLQFHKNRPIMWNTNTSTSDLSMLLFHI
ncbi:MAG: hypothetical protein IPM69_06800 [Ignavibacteria bacterium]|nr:hypothetical protein [Ignavibacteria bacterium]